MDGCRSFIMAGVLFVAGIQAIKITTTDVGALIHQHLARTVMTIEVENEQNKTVKDSFYVTPPMASLISGLSMSIKNKSYSGIIMGRRRAGGRQGFFQVWSNKNTALLESWEEIESIHKVTIILEPKTLARLKVTFQQLLHKVRGRYKYELSIHGNHTSVDLGGSVRLCEPLMQTDGSANDESKVSPFDFKDLAHEDNLDTSRFLLEYEPSGKTDPEVFFEDGYFAYFGPQLQVPPRRVMLVFDFSQSLYGESRSQMKKAMRNILSTLTPDDRFGVLKFSWLPNAWKEKLVTASAENVNSALTFISSNITPSGKNIWRALKLSLKMLRDDAKNEPSNPQYNFLVLLTDGVTSKRTGRMLRNAFSHNRYKFAIHTMLYEGGSSDTMLFYLAGQNGGKFCRISKLFDVSPQVEENFNEIGKGDSVGIPLELEYHGVGEVVAVRTPYGGVITRTGKLSDNDDARIILTAQESDGQNTTYLTRFVHTRTDYGSCRMENKKSTVEMIYRIVKMKEALEQVKIQHVRDKKRLYMKHTRNISIELGFVTPYASLLAVSDGDMISLG